MDGIIKSVKVQCEGLEQKVDEVFRGIKFSEPGKFLAEAQTKSRSLAKMHVENDTVYGDYNKITSVIKQEQAELVSAQQQDSFKPLIPESLTPTKTPQQSIIVKPAENKTFMQKALNVLDLAGDVYTAYKISSWGCGILADLLGLDKYALSGIDYVLDMGKNYLTNLLNAPKQVKELTAVVEQKTAQVEEKTAENKKLEAVVEEVTTQKEELKSQLDETVGQLQEVKAEKEELKAVVEEVTTQKEDIQIQLAEKAKDFTKCTAEVCKITKENSILSKIALTAVSILLVGLAGCGVKFYKDWKE